MRIAIDARMMSPLNARGIGRYIEELVRGMLGQANPTDRFVLLTRQPGASPFLNHPLVEHQTADIQWYTLAEQLRMPHLLREAKADLVHVPHWNAPLLYRGPLVLTIHDLILRHQTTSAKASTHHPLFAATKRFGYRLLLADVIHKAQHLFVPTQFVANDVQTLYPSTRGKITVTSEGIGNFPVEDTRLVPNQPYLFYVGSAYPHKRLDLLFRAWKQLHTQHPDLQLVIAGEKDVFMERHLAWVREHQLPRVQFLGRISDAALAALDHHALAFVFPSSQEGFGLPPLEALSVGTPVVSSDSSCLTEVLPKEGVFFFRDSDLNGMINAIEAVLRDPMRARSQVAVQQSLLRTRYAWQDVAARTLEGYRRCLSHR